MQRKTLKKMLKWYLDLPDVKQFKTVESRKASLERSTRFFGTRRPADSLKSLDLLSYQKYLMSFDFAPATINKEMCYITNMLKKAIGYGWVDMSMPMSIPLRVNNTREKMLSIEDFSRLLKNCSPDISLLVETAYWTPMRRSEFLTLTWDSVDLKNGCIMLGWSHTKKRYSRLVPLRPSLIKKLSSVEWKRGLVFHIDGKKISDSRLARYFKKACESADIFDFVFHDLRHCAANNMRLAGNELSVIMKAGGWKSVQALERYLLVNPEEVKLVKWL